MFSLSFSLHTLQFAPQSSSIVVKVVFLVLVETRVQRCSKERGQTASWGRASTGAPLQFVLAKLDFAWS